MKSRSETFLHNLKVGDFAEHIEVCLSFSNFNLGDTIKELAGGLLGIPLSLNCGEEETDPGVEKWTIGSGPTQSLPFDINSILDVAKMWTDNDLSKITFVPLRKNEGQHTESDWMKTYSLIKWRAEKDLSDYIKSCKILNLQ